MNRKVQRLQPGMYQVHLMPLAGGFYSVLIESAGFESRFKRPITYGSHCQQTCNHQGNGKRRDPLLNRLTSPAHNLHGDDRLNKGASFK